MEINFERHNEALSHLIIFITLGITTAIQNNAVFPEEGEVCLFNPYIAKYLDQIGFNKDIIELIELCMELDDIRRLVPDSFSNSLSEIQQKCISLLKNMDDLKYPITRYFD